MTPLVGHLVTGIDADGVTMRAGGPSSASGAAR